MHHDEMFKRGRGVPESTLLCGPRDKPLVAQGVVVLRDLVTTLGFRVLGLQGFRVLGFQGVRVWGLP